MKNRVKYRSIGSAFSFRNNVCVRACVCVHVHMFKCVFMCWGSCSECMCNKTELHQGFQAQEGGVQNLQGDILLTKQNINNSEYGTCISGENVDLV